MNLEMDLKGAGSGRTDSKADRREFINMGALFSDSRLLIPWWNA